MSNIHVPKFMLISNKIVKIWRKCPKISQDATKKASYIAKGAVTEQTQSKLFMKTVSHSQTGYPETTNAAHLENIVRAMNTPVNPTFIQ